MYQYITKWLHRIFLFSSAINAFFNTVDINASVVLLAETPLKFTWWLLLHCSSLAPIVLVIYFTFMLILAQSCKALINFNSQGLGREWKMCLALSNLLIFYNIILFPLHKQWFFGFGFSFFFCKVILPVSAANVFCHICISSFLHSSPITFDAFL